MNVKEELLNLEQEQRKLSKFVGDYNLSTIEQNKEIREILADSTKALQT